MHMAKSSVPMQRLGCEALKELAAKGQAEEMVAAGAIEAVTHAMTIGARDPGLQRAACEALGVLAHKDARASAIRAADCDCFKVIASTLRAHVVIPWVCSATMEAIVI